MKFNTTVEFNEKEKESAIIVHDMVETIKDNMGSMGIVEDIYGSDLSKEDFCKFEDLLSSFEDKGIKIKEAEK